MLSENTALSVMSYKLNRSSESIKEQMNEAVNASAITAVNIIISRFVFIIIMNCFLVNYRVHRVHYNLRGLIPS